MLKFDRTGRNLERLSVKSLYKANILERRDIQDMIVRNPDPFFEEMGERLVLIGQEVCPSHHVGDRIDLLAVDEVGRAVVIELKRSDNKLQLLQALSYVAMLADWSVDEFIATRSQFTGEPRGASTDAIRDHLRTSKTELDDLNRGQRVILVAEAFDFALLKTAEWLSERYGVGIRCYRIEYVEDNSAEYISCVRIFPPSGIVDTAARVRKDTPSAENRRNTSWADLMSGVKNADVRAFFEKNHDDGEKRLGSRDIAFRIKGERRLFAGVRINHAYVWQKGRFDGDLVYWREVLSAPSKVQPVDGERSLSFILKTDEDMSAFEKAVKKKLREAAFVEQDTGPFLDGESSADEAAVSEDT
ncbi:MAG: hypothetical protein OEL76_09370 [Siculibacillus sp.]|nr:hypothetical protein [Siculibacillus sp.]